MSLCRWMEAAASIAWFVVGLSVAGNVELATVTVATRTTFGEPVSNAQITLTSIGLGQRFVASGAEPKFNRIPFGYYDLEISLAGFAPRKEHIRIFQRDLSLQIGLELGATHAYQRPSVVGTVKLEEGKGTELWVRMVALYSGDLVENAVDRSGHFELSGMAQGKYVVILFEGDKVVATKPLYVQQGKQVIGFDLPQKSVH